MGGKEEEERVRSIDGVKNNNVNDVNKMKRTKKKLWQKRINEDFTCVLLLTNTFD